MSFRFRILATLAAVYAVIGHALLQTVIGTGDFVADAIGVSLVLLLIPFGLSDVRRSRYTEVGKR
jgi:hypothetical protein